MQKEGVMHCNYRNLLWYGIAAGFGENALFYLLVFFTPLEFSGAAFFSGIFAIISCLFLSVPVCVLLSLPKLKKSGIAVEAKVLSTRIEGENQNSKQNRMSISTIRFEICGKTFIKKLYNFTIFRCWTRTGENLSLCVDPGDTDNYLVIPRGRAFVIFNAVFGTLFQAAVIAVTASSCTYNK